MPVLSAIRRLSVGIRDAIDGRLHSRRRRRARDRIARVAPSSVLFVCFGNICRSPFGARVWTMRSYGIPATSAGFFGPARSPPEAALTVARERGVDHADHRSRVITREILESAGAVFIFDRFNSRELSKWPEARRERVFWLGDFDPHWSGKRAIVDPWGRPEDDFRLTFERIERCIDDALRAVAAVGHAPVVGSNDD